MLKRFLGASALVLAACATATTAGPVAPVARLGAAAVSTEETLRALNAMCGAEAVATPGEKLTITKGVGTGGFRVDSASADAQAWFDYGLALSHAFYHADAIAAMKEAVKADPSCARCAWGEAWVEGPTLNYGIDDRQRLVALAAAERALKLAKPDDALARRLAEAAVARYAIPVETEGRPGAGEGETDHAFGEAMKAIAADHPSEPEIAVLAAHALLIPVRGEDERGLKPALAMLEAVLKQRPDDTGAIHYYIHGTEFDGRAEDALPYADKLARLAPEASHLVHMPAHTFFRAGRYADAALVNALAIGADVDWTRAGGEPSVPAFLVPPPSSAPKGSESSSAAMAKAGEGSPQTPLPMYYAHNLAFGLTGAMMAGDRELALKYASHAKRVYADRPAGQAAYPMTRAFVVLARYAPDEALALPEAPNDRMAAYRHYARGEAMLAKGDAVGALAEAKAIGRLKEARGAPEAEIARRVLEGRAVLAAGNPRKAAAIFLKAAKIQDDKLAESWDPPSWWYPVRRSAAAAYLEAGDFAKAKAEAEASLRTWKHDPLALWVLGKAEAGLGNSAAADAHLAEARRIWRGDFDTITARAI